MNWCIPAMIILLIIFAVGWAATLIWSLLIRKVAKTFKKSYLDMKDSLETEWQPRVLSNDELRRILIWYLAFNPAMTRDEDMALIKKINKLLNNALVGDRAQVPGEEHMIPKPPTGEVPSNEKTPPMPKGETVKSLEQELAEDGWVNHKGHFGASGEDLLEA